MTQIHEYSSLFTAGLAMSSTTSLVAPSSSTTNNNTETQSSNLTEAGRSMGKLLTPIVVNTQPVKTPPARCRRRSSVTLLLSPITEHISNGKAFALREPPQASIESGAASAPYYTQRFKIPSQNTEQMASMLSYGKILRANGARRRSPSKAKPPPTSPLPAIPDTPPPNNYGTRQPLASIQV